MGTFSAHRICYSLDGFTGTPLRPSLPSSSPRCLRLCLLFNVTSAGPLELPAEEALACEVDGLVRKHKATSRRPALSRSFPLLVCKPASSSHSVSQRLSVCVIPNRACERVEPKMATYLEIKKERSSKASSVQRLHSTNMGQLSDIKYRREKAGPSRREKQRRLLAQGKFSAHQDPDNES